MKLLIRTVRNYALVSALLFILSTPLFYWAIYSLVIRQMDASLIEHKSDFLEAAQYIDTEAELNKHQRMNKEFSVKIIDTPLADRFYTEEVFDSAKAEYHPYRIYSTTITLHSQPHELRVRESMVSSKDLVSAIVSIQAVLLVLLFIALVLINRQLSNTIWYPFYLIVNRLKNYRIDKDTSLQLPTSSTLEFRDLSEAIDLLIQKNKSTYLAQKEFTENASHEMQTPLAILNGKIDLLMQTELSEYQAELIGSIQHSTARLSKLNRNLLLLAKIDNQQYNSKESINLSSVITALLDQFEEAIQQRSLQLSSALDTKVLIKSNKALVEILMSNLLTNAIRYSPAGSVIRLKLTASTFTIQNDGTPFKNPASIFNRFSKEDQSSAGTGLGLALVKQVCSELGFDIRYAHQQGRHIFTLRFD